MEPGLWLLLGLTVTSAAGKREGRGGAPLHAGVHTKGSQERVCAAGKLSEPDSSPSSFPGMGRGA